MSAKRYTAKGMPAFAQNRRQRHSSQVTRRWPQLKTSAKAKTTKVYKCRVNGCHKLFYNYNTLVYHKNKHLSRGQTEDIGGHSMTTSTVPMLTIQEKMKRFGLKSYYESDMTLGQIRFVCLICDHKTYGSGGKARMVFHLNRRHRQSDVYRCDRDNCGKVYKNPESYRYHKLCHLCGYGLDKTKRTTMDTLCSDENLLRFRERIQINGFSVWKCTFDGICQLMTTNGNALKRHIHEQHVCPYRQRLPTSFTYKGCTSIELIQRLDHFCQLRGDGNQRLYKCRMCDFLGEKLNGFLAHIRNKHFKVGQRKYLWNKMTEESIKQEMLAKRQSRDEAIVAANDNCKHNDRPNDKAKDDKDNSVVKSPWMPFECERCFERFDDLLVMRRHLRSHIKF